MCRLIAYAGPPITLDALVSRPPHSLVRQSYEPREQRFGSVNADGFGVGWFSPVRPEPAVYRSTRPIWADRSFASIAGVIESDTVVAAVRSATPPSIVEEPATQPFESGPWVFLHNGFIDHFRTEKGVELRRSVSTRRAAEIMSGADSEVVFALVLDALDRGAAPADAVAEVVAKLRPGNDGGLNVVLARRHHVVVTRCNNSLWTMRRDIGGRTAFFVASEAFDDDPGWTEVPDSSIVEIGAGSLSTRPF